MERVKLVNSVSAHLLEVNAHHLVRIVVRGILADNQVVADSLHEVHLPAENGGKNSLGLGELGGPLAALHGDIENKD